jgi:hypothetical protein
MKKVLNEMWAKVNCRVIAGVVLFVLVVVCIGAVIFLAR